MPTVNLILSDVVGDKVCLDFISQKYSFSILKISDEFRFEFENRTELGLKIQEEMRLGKNIKKEYLEEIWKSAFKKRKQKDILIPLSFPPFFEIISKIVEDSNYDFGRAWRIKRKIPFLDNGIEISEKMRGWKHMKDKFEQLNKAQIELANIFKWEIVDFDEFIQNNQ